MTQPARQHRPGHLMEHLPLREPLAAEFDELFVKINRFLESAAPSWTKTAGWSPRADMYESDEAFVLECELPGMKREDIDIALRDRQLSITGELQEREHEGVRRRGTRRSGRFEYRDLLPCQVKAEDVHASLSDGILTVTIPKAPATEPRHIEITD